MSAVARWCCVAVGVLVLVSVPVVVHSLPAPDQDVSATALLRRVQGSADQPFTGLAETAGDVPLPKNDAISGLTKVYADTNRVRVWWRSPTTWRLATLRPTGETDLLHHGDRTVRWVYESRAVTFMPDVPVRLPDITDVVPHRLGLEALTRARASEVHRLPSRRVAGHDALGLRLRPADRSSAIARVDLWADRATGVPLRVEEYAKGVARPVLTSSYVDFHAGRPAASSLRFTVPPGASTRYDDIVDLASAADRFASRVPPGTLAGLPRRPRPPGQFPGAVGVYGRGPTELLAVPLWRPAAHRVRHDLAGRPGVRPVDQGLLLAAAPLRLLLAEPEPDGTSWLLFGTVTDQGLARAADQLRRHRPGVRAPGRAPVGTGS